MTEKSQRSGGNCAVNQTLEFEFAAKVKNRDDDQRCRELVDEAEAGDDDDVPSAGREFLELT